VRDAQVPRGKLKNRRWFLWVGEEGFSGFLFLFFFFSLFMQDQGKVRSRRGKSHAS
jgi:hypothetical protein